LTPDMKKTKPSFPERTVANPVRRKDRLTDQLTDATSKEYRKRNRSVRISRGTIDPAVWLREQYTNNAEQMVCQICKEEMPFRKRDGDYYFEAVEAFSKEHLIKEHDAQYLALCPTCAAMYKEFIKSDEDTMVELKNMFLNTDSNDFEVSIHLGKLKTSIRFVEVHLHDIKSILDGFE